MDVSLSRARASGRLLWATLAFASLIFISCGNRYDLSTERGRRARIDDANFHLSQGECAAAAESIDPLYGSVYENDEVRIIKASTFACFARFNMLTMISNLSSESDFFKGAVKSLDNTAADSARYNFYRAVDVLSRSGTAINGGDRTKAENGYMVFLQLGIIGAVLRNYGAPNSDGTQGTSLVYETAGANPATEMSNADACALAASYSFITDSFRYSDLNDDKSTSIVSALNASCALIGGGITSCPQLNRDRTACDGTNVHSQRAETIVGGVNTSWQ